MKKVVVVLISIFALLFQACNSSGTSDDDLTNLLLLIMLRNSNGSGSSESEAINCQQTASNPISSGVTGGNCAEPSFTTNGDGTITDTANNLLWTLCAVKNTGHYGTSSTCTTPNIGTETYNQTDAQTHCNNLNHAGRTDWVLPDIVQLRMLGNPNRGSAPYIYQPPFTSNWGASPTYMTTTVNNNASYPIVRANFNAPGIRNSVESGIPGSTGYVRCVVKL